MSNINNNHDNKDNNIDSAEDLKHRMAGRAARLSEARLGVPQQWPELTAN